VRIGQNSPKDRPGIAIRFVFKCPKSLQPIGAAFFLYQTFFTHQESGSAAGNYEESSRPSPLRFSFCSALKRYLFSDIFREYQDSVSKIEPSIFSEFPLSAFLPIKDFRGGMPGDDGDQQVSFVSRFFFLWSRRDLSTCIHFTTTWYAILPLRAPSPSSPLLSFPESWQGADRVFPQVGMIITIHASEL